MKFFFFLFVLMTGTSLTETCQYEQIEEEEVHNIASARVVVPSSWNKLSHRDVAEATSYNEQVTHKHLVLKVLSYCLLG